MASPAAAACRSKRGGTFVYPRFTPSGDSSVSYGKIVVDHNWCPTASGDSRDACQAYNFEISQILINGVSAIGTYLPSYQGTSSTPQNNMAQSIAQAINDQNSTPEYRACAGNSTSGLGCRRAPFSTFGLGTVAENTVMVVAYDGTVPVADASRAGFPIAVTANTSVGLLSSWARLKVNNSGTGSGNVSSIRVGPVGGPYTEILSGPLSSNFGSNSKNNRQAAGRVLCQKINTLTASTGYAAYSGTSVSDTSTSCSGDDDFFIRAPRSAGGTPNGYEVLITDTGNNTDVAVSTVDNTKRMQGGYATPTVPTSTYPFVAGSSVISAFVRTNIVPATANYPKAAVRADCVTSPGVCTYDEEMTNFSNWYAYYRTRNQTMKSAASHAFLPIADGYRLGFNTINNTTFNDLDVGKTNWLPTRDLTPTHKSNWYTKLFAASGNSATPLRGALNRMGSYFTGTLADTNSPIEFSCQRNYTILTTDGYWNESYSGMGNVDNVNVASQFCTRANGCYDGDTGATNTLSDVAAHYYMNDIRDDLIDNVPVTPSDPNPAQHMTTFTLGLGVDGRMTYRPDYETATSGDFYRVRTGDTGCEWVTGTCNWPVPQNLTDTAVDDLWHAAASGHGKYFSAQDPSSLAAGLSGALNALQIRTGAASASATSTPNITQEDNFEFSATFRTVKWDGELVAQHINIIDGSTNSAVIWSAQTQLQTKAGSGTVAADGTLTGTADGRTIFTTTASGTPAYREWRWSELTTAERSWFADMCAGTGVLGQCVSLSASQKTLANNGELMVDYLRGQQALEAFAVTADSSVQIFRSRDHILGDLAGSKPAYVAKPKREFSDAGYGTFKLDNAAREAMIYVGGNDGMLHAFDVSDGNERWAYVPRMVMPNLHKLASTTYGTNHQFYVDGSPSVGDVFVDGAWKTILVGGLNKGGRGYFALDITDPDAPVPMWEICSDAALCPYRNDADMGYSFAEPIITKRPSDGKWVVLVTSGYNNVSPGSGVGYLYVLDASNGEVLNKISNGTGSTIAPDGLAKIADYAEAPDTDSTSLQVYGGDLFGNVFRFDLATNTVITLSVLTDASGTRQPITTRPETGKCEGQKMIFVGTGKYLGVSDVETTQLQTVWGIHDHAAALGALRTSGTLSQRVLTTTASGRYTISDAGSVVTDNNGWYVDLDRNSGERVNLDPVLINSNLVVVSNKPTSDGSAACGTGGKGFLYQFSYCNGLSPDHQADTEIGFQISDSIVVGFSPIGLPSGVVVLKITTAEGTKLPPVPIMQPGGGGGDLRRINWSELND
ncbi:PilC/PilY family type IV pilus protein [Rhodoferax sp.]|uniref:pilus assembly protein n=1 Tax=Rhodoferax sp. TaxID=50421 RepID=UPI0026346AD6|nr:PilC/PilY family type IV pilus protein [Rhodoferax sp.]MDD2919240.1 PilC/PilY family type IV pilus protein [Rhodoferax sp.]